MDEALSSVPKGIPLNANFVYFVSKPLFLDYSFLVVIFQIDLNLNFCNMSWKNGRYISGTRGVVFRLEQMQRQKRKRKAKASALFTSLSSQQNNDKYTPLFNKDGTFINAKYYDHNPSELGKKISNDARLCSNRDNPYASVIIKKRYIGFWFGVGIFFFPFFFSWFTLRKGYSTLAKVISLGWLLFAIVISASKQP